MKYEELGKGVVRRRERKRLGLFIDGTGLDRATRRLNRKVEMSSLVRGVSAGLTPIVARYYTLIPFEDDSRQRAYLDAVERAGISVIVKRLPPKGVARQVSIDVEMATDMVAFALGSNKYGEFENESTPTTDNSSNPRRGQVLPLLGKLKQPPIVEASPSRAANLKVAEPPPPEPKPNEQNGVTPDESRILTVICPSRELSYTLSFIRALGVSTTTADFGQFSSHELMKLSSKWIDLSDSETIWRE